MCALVCSCVCVQFARVCFVYVYYVCNVYCTYVCTFLYVCCMMWDDHAHAHIPPLAVIPMVLAQSKTNPSKATYEIEFKVTTLSPTETQP